MKFTLTALITIKEKEKYTKKKIVAFVNLRNRHYKINQPINLKIDFEKALFLTASCIVYSNKFTNLPLGRFKLLDIAFRGVKVDRFEVGFGTSGPYKS